MNVLAAIFDHKNKAMPLNLMETNKNIHYGEKLMRVLDILILKGCKKYFKKI